MSFSASSVSPSMRRRLAKQNHRRSPSPSNYRKHSASLSPSNLRTIGELSTRSASDEQIDCYDTIEKQVDAESRRTSSSSDKSGVISPWQSYTNSTANVSLSCGGWDTATDPTPDSSRNSSFSNSFKYVSTKAPLAKLDSEKLE